MPVYAVNKKKGTNRCFFSNVLNSIVFYCSWLRKPNLRGSSAIVFKQCQRNTQISVGGGEHAQKPKKPEKKLHTTFGSVQFLASFISFYFEILSYLACGEKIIKLASKNIVKLGRKSATNF